jgi:hypothetical protein
MNASAPITVMAIIVRALSAPWIPSDVLAIGTSLMRATP